MKLLVSILLVISLPTVAGKYLGELTWPEAQKAIKQSPIVIIPFGAGAKEHGPHLPMNADQVVMEYLLEQAKENADVIIAPAILHGWFPAFREFPGTEVKDPGIFRQYVQQVAESLVRQGANRIVFFNMGIAKATGLPLSIAAREVRTELGVATLVVNWDDLETEEVADIFAQSAAGHADEIETSINLYLQPELVQMDKASKDYRLDLKKDYRGYRPGLFSQDKADPFYSSTGVSGDPTLATAEKGQKILAVMSREWLNILDGFSKSPIKTRVEK